MIGTRSKLAWGMITVGSGRSLFECKSFLQNLNNFQNSYLHWLRGGFTMFDITQTI